MSLAHELNEVMLASIQPKIDLKLTELKKKFFEAAKKGEDRYLCEEYHKFCESECIGRQIIKILEHDLVKSQYVFYDRVLFTW